MRRKATLFGALTLMVTVCAPAFALPSTCAGSGDYNAPATATAPFACTGGALARPGASKAYYGFANVQSGNAVHVMLLAASPDASATNLPPFASIEVRGPEADHNRRTCVADPASPAACTVTADANGTWIVGVVESGTGAVTYALSVAVAGAVPTVSPTPTPTGTPTGVPSPLPTPDPGTVTGSPAPLGPCEGATDAGETPDRAIPAPSWLLNGDEILCTGAFTLGEADQADWFTVRVKSSRALLTVLVLPPLGGDVDVKLVNPNGEAAVPTINGGVSQPHVFLVDNNHAIQGLWRIGVAAGRAPKPASYTVLASIVEL
jgi:hypothetical protein